MNRGVFTCTLIGSADELLPTDALPLFCTRVPAGFPSPADDYLEGTLNLQEHLVRNPAATFLLRVEGQSMIGAGIHDGDLLVVDRAIDPEHGRIVVAIVEGEFVVKRLIYEAGRCLLRSANARYPDFEVTEVSNNHVWGVVTNVIHRV